MWSNKAQISQQTLSPIKWRHLLGFLSLPEYQSLSQPFNLEQFVLWLLGSSTVTLDSIMNIVVLCLLGTCCFYVISGSSF